MTAGRAPALLREATARLAAAGVASPRVDAELLLAAAWGVPRGRLAALDEVPAATATTFAEHVARRVAREPVQHITGQAPFRRLVLAVGDGVFVPRPETELLVDAVLPHLRGLHAPVAVDLCAGSGALALAVADELPGATVTAVERAEPALDWLRRNAVGAEVWVVAGDVSDPGLLTELHGRIDAVVSNPPYVPLTAAVEPEVCADPADAVFAGADGLAVIPHVLARAAELLKPGGVLAVEHDETQDDAVAGLLNAGPWTGVAAHRDLAGRPRYATAIRR
jgi:release factor glutamine methyltransferase